MNSGVGVDDGIFVPKVLLPGNRGHGVGSAAIIAVGGSNPTIRDGRFGVGQADSNLGYIKNFPKLIESEFFICFLITGDTFYLKHLFNNLVNQRF